MCLTQKSTFTNLSWRSDRGTAEPGESCGACRGQRFTHNVLEHELLGQGFFCRGTTGGNRGPCALQCAVAPVRPACARHTRAVSPRYPGSLHAPPCPGPPCAPAVPGLSACPTIPGLSARPMVPGAPAASASQRVWAPRGPAAQAEQQQPSSAVGRSFEQMAGHPDVLQR